MPQEEPSAMNQVSLKEHFETRLAALEKAVEVASRSLDKRLDSMNEFRDTLKDQAARMATRAELDMAIGAINRDLRELREYKAALEGKASQQSVNGAWLLAFISMAVAVILKFVR